MSAAADRHSRIGLLALQTGLIDQAQLVAAFQAWTLDKSRHLAQILVGRGDLNEIQRSLMESLADQHLEKHGALEKSPAAVSAGKATWDSLARIGDPEIEATIQHIASAPCRDHGRRC